MSQTADLGEPLVPTIDVSPFLTEPDSETAAAVIASVRQACIKTGFFQIIGHGLDENIQREFLEAAHKFFALDREKKQALDARNFTGRRGYDAMASQSYNEKSLPDLKEGFYVGHDVPEDHPKVQARRFFMGPNVWPDDLEARQFRQPVEAYFQGVHDLALRMLELIARTLNHGPAIFADFTSGYTVSILRLLHYPPMPASESNGSFKQQLGAGEHTDFGAITLLLQDEHAGLEVLDPQTNEYVPVSPSPGALVFNVGDMLSVFTNGEYRSSWHRVINKAPTDRYSAAFFYDGEHDCVLKTMKQEKQEGKSLHADVLTVEKHLFKRLAQSYGEEHKI